MLRMNLRGIQNRIEPKEILFPYFSIVALFMVFFIVGIGIALLLRKEGYREIQAVGLFIAVLVMAIIVNLRQDELAATIVVAISIILDWYLGTHIVAPVIALALLLIFFLTRSPERPWTKPRVFWLWILFLGLTLLPAIRGAVNLTDPFYYYPNLMFGAFILFWLGTAIARDVTSIRKFFQMLAALGMLIALHMIIQAFTGNFLFLTPKQQSYLASVADYQLGTTGIARLGSFFIQPDATSAFLAIIFLISLGLFVECSSPFKKLFYLIQTLCIAIALFLTYSTGAWYSLAVGLVVYFLLIRIRAYYAIIMTILLILMCFIFQKQILLFIHHASDPGELSLRQGLWQTGWRVIQAFPLTGIGLSRALYLKRAEPYRVPAQYKPYNNPHNSYIELGAMAGIPVLFIFVALIAFALWLALRHWKQADSRQRSLFGAGIAAIIALSFNSLSFGVWTLPPLAACGWIILGVISSPLIAKSENARTAKQTK